MGTDKARLLVEGQPLVLRVAERVAEAARPMLLASGTPGRLGPLPYAEVADEVPGSGPLGGLTAGLAASPHQLVAVVAVDMPFASPQVLSLLCTLRRDEDAVVPVTDRGPEPLHAVYARDALPALRRALEEGRWTLREVVEGMHARFVPPAEWREADPSAHFALNLNRAGDLALLR